MKSQIKKERLKLDAIKVESFVTDREDKALKGGTNTSVSLTAFTISGLSEVVNFCPPNNQQ